MITTIIVLAIAFPWLTAISLFYLWRESRDGGDRYQVALWKSWKEAKQQESVK